MRRLMVLLGIGGILIAAEVAWIFWQREPVSWIGRRPAVHVTRQRPMYGWRPAVAQQSPGLPNEQAVPTAPTDDVEPVPGTERGSAEIGRIVEELQQVRGR